MKTCYSCGWTKKESDFSDNRNTCRKCVSNTASDRYRIKSEADIKDRLANTKQALLDVDKCVLSGNIDAALQLFVEAKNDGLHAATIESSKYDEVNDCRCKLEVMRLAVEQMAERAKNENVRT